MIFWRANFRNIFPGCTPQEAYPVTAIKTSSTLGPPHVHPPLEPGPDHVILPCHWLRACQPALFAPKHGAQLQSMLPICQVKQFPANNVTMISTVSWNIIIGWTGRVWIESSIAKDLILEKQGKRHCSQRVSDSAIKPHCFCRHGMP